MQNRKWPQDLARKQTVLRDAQDAIIGYLLLGTDNTANTARQQAEEDRNRFFALSGDMLCILGFDGYFKDLNPAWEKTLGYTKAELLAKPYMELIHPDDLQITLAEAEKVSGGKALIAFENRYRCKDGSYRWFLWSVTPVIEDRVMYGVARDITERKQAEEAQRTSEARYRTLFECAPDGLAILDSKSYYLDGNGSICRMLGYTRDELIGLHASKVVAETEIQHIGKAFIATTAGSAYYREWQFRRKDDSLFEAEVIATKMPDGNLLGMIRDITQRKQAEEALQESEARFRMMANCILQLAWIAHADGYIFWYNQRWYKYTGTTPEQMEGWGWQSVHAPEVLSKVIENWKAAIDAGKPFEMEFPLRGADGRFRSFLTHVQPLKDSEGRVVQWFGTNTDVDELKQAEEKIRLLNSKLEQRVVERTTQLETANTELRHSRSELKSLFESLPGLYLVLTPDLKIVAASDAYLKATLTTREDVLDHNLFELFPDNPDDPGTTAVANLRASVDRVIRNIASDTMAIQKHDIRRPDGVFEERYWSPINSPVFGADRQIKYIVHRVEEVTEFVLQKSQLSGSTTELSNRMQKMEAEIFQNSQQLRAANQQLEAANKELEAFSYSVSHDLRAPLRAVNGFAGIVMNEFGPQLPADARHYLERIRNGGQQMGVLIDDLLTFSRLSRQPLNRHTVDTAQLVQSVLDDLTPQREGRQIEIKIGALPDCWGDKALLKQVWVNLLSNATKYSRGREPAVIEIGCESGTRENVYFVGDNGTGFDMKYAPKLFGVFQRLHRADEFEGTGVGLAIVQRIVHRHGGRVWAEAEKGRGAIFRFTLEKEKRL